MREGGPEFYNNPEVNLEQQITELYKELQVSEEDEKLALAEQSSDMSAINLGRQRSFKNIRSSIQAYIEWQSRLGIKPKEAAAELITKAQETKDNLVMAFYANPLKSQRILESGKLKNLFEFEGQEQDKNKKPGELGLEAALAKRVDVDRALGWEKPHEVYHLAAEERNETLAKEGPGSNYGSVRFVFDFEKLNGYSTFTEGDSLNPNHLPDSLQAMGNKNNTTPSRGVENRQISKEHVPIAKAILSLSTKHEYAQDLRRPLFLRYIEAQIGGITGEEILRNLTSIEIDLNEAFGEAKFNKLLHDTEKETEAEIKFIGKPANSRSRFANMFSEETTPEPAPDYEGYRKEIANIGLNKFQEFINQIKSYCEQKNISFKTKGDINKIAEAYHISLKPL